MPRKATPAPAERSDAPLEALHVRPLARDGVLYPAVFVKGEAPRKGSTIRVRLPNGVTYAGRVHATSEGEGEGEVMVETEGLEPVTE